MQVEIFSSGTGWEDKATLGSQVGVLGVDHPRLAFPMLVLLHHLAGDSLAQVLL